jgi:hypothetical protein
MTLGNRTKKIPRAVDSRSLHPVNFSRKSLPKKNSLIWKSPTSGNRRATVRSNLDKKTEVTTMIEENHSQPEEYEIDDFFYEDPDAERILTTQPLIRHEFISLNRVKPQY